MAPDIPIEHAVHDPGSVHVRLSYRLARRCPPDRLRSLFDYLKALDRPVTFVSFPDRLYQASEALVANGGTLQPMPVLQTLDGGTRAVAININTSAAWTDVEIDWGSVIGMFDMLASPAVLDVLRAGARILAAGSGELALHSPNTGRACIALWLDAGLAEKTRVDGMTVMAEEWDGARLFLAVPQAVHRAMQDDGARNVDSRAIPAATLALALVSPDWRLRMAAAILVGRLRIEPLAGLVQRMEVPDTGTPGVTSERRHMLLAIRKAVLVLLSGVEAPEISAEAPDTRPGMQAHLLRCISGLPVAFEDDFSALVRSLV